VSRARRHVGDWKLQRTRGTIGHQFSARIVCTVNMPADPAGLQQRQSATPGTSKSKRFAPLTIRLRFHKADAVWASPFVGYSA